MNIFKSIALITAACLVLSACATTPDPAKICTADWISTRSDKAISRIETRSKSSFKSLKRIGESWAKGKTASPLQLLALSRSMKRLKKELTSGQGVKDLRTLSNTCHDPEIISTAMHNLLERQGLSNKFITFIEQSPIFERIIEDIAAPELTRT